MYAEQVVKHAVAKEAFNERYPGNYKYNGVEPGRVVYWGKRAYPPNAEHEPENSVKFSKVLFHKTV